MKKTIIYTSMILALLNLSVFSAQDAPMGGDDQQGGGRKRPCSSPQGVSGDGEPQPTKKLKT